MSPADPVWRETDGGKGVTLVATGAAIQALGIEPPPSPQQAPQARRWVSTGTRGAAASELASAAAGQDPRGDEASAADRHAAAGRRRDHRPDRRGDRLAAAHGARRARRGVEEAARARRHLGEGRGARAGVSHRRLISRLHCSKPGGQMVARLSHSRRQQVRSDDGTIPRIALRRLVRTISGA